MVTRGITDYLFFTVQDDVKPQFVGVSLPSAGSIFFHLVCTLPWVYTVQVFTFSWTSVGILPTWSVESGIVGSWSSKAYWFGD